MLFQVPDKWHGVPHLSFGEPKPGLAYEERVCSRGVIRLDDDMLLMTTTEQYHEYVFPGGGLEPGENLEDGLVREVMEETGYLVNPLSATPLCITEDYRNQPDRGICVNMVSFFFTCEACKRGEPRLDAGETRTGLHPELVTVELALDRNTEILAKKNLFWVERDSAVLKLLSGAV